MERSEELFEKIEAYLNARMTGDEARNFQREMEENEDLRNEVELHRELNRNLKNGDTVAFRKKVRQASTERPKNKNISLLNVLKIAAVLIILVGVAAFFLLNTTDSGSGIYEKYYQQYPIEDMLRGSDADDERLELNKKYTRGEYANIVADYERLVDENPDEVIIQMYLANCYLNTREEKKAIALFENVQKNNKYYEAAQWYLALSYLKLNDTGRAGNVLQGVVSYDGVHKENALKILNELKIKDPDDE